MCIKVKFKDQDAYEARFRALQIVNERAAIKSVNGVLPNEEGDVVLTPADINAVSAEDIANIRGTFRINVTYSGAVYSADKTFDEIKAAYDAGQQPYVVYGGDTIYTLSSCYFASEQMFMDFERYLIWEDTLKTETLRIYSYTLESGSNIKQRTDEFNVPSGTTYIAVASTDDVISTVNGETYADIQALINAGKLVVVRYDDILDFYYFETFGFSDSSGTHKRLNFRCVMGSIVYTLTLKDDNTWVISETSLQPSSITDSGGYFTTDTVEGALQEIGADLAGAYSKPSSGIPKTDLANDVQASLGKAETALQEHQSLATYRTAAAQDEIDNGKVDKVAGKGLSTNDYNATEKSNNASNTSARHSHGNKALLDGIDASKISLWNSGAQQTPLFANTTADCTDTTKVYVLPDGYIYGYINGAWTNTGHQFTNSEALEKVIDATCDVETISGGNYNLLKVSEVSFSSRLQDNVAGITASTATNIVTGWIPVQQGKYYAVSALVDGVKDAAAGDGRCFVQRINAKKADGTILVYNRYPTELCTELSRGKAYSVPTDATHMMFHIQIQDRTPQSLDISTSAKLKAFEPMIVEGDTAVLAVSNSIDFEYLDGDVDAPAIVNYTLKHDPYVTSALFSEQTDVVITKIGAEIGRSLTTAGSTNPNPASVTTAFLINRSGATITVPSNAYRFQVSEFSAKSDSALVRYSGVLDYGTTFTTGASPYVRIAIRNADGNTADLNILDNITISVSEQSNFVSANRRMDDIEYRLRSVEGADASPFKRDVDYSVIPTSYYKGVGTNYTTTFNADTQYASFISAWDALISDHSGYVTKTNLGLCSDESQSLYLYDFKPVRAAEQMTPTPKVIITAGQHGNEKANVFGLYYFIDNLLNNWFKHPALEYLRTNVELLIVPVVNPSGFNNKTYKNSNGVNINRNYDAGWVLVDDSTSDQYGGAAPFDQPESIIIRDLILDNLDALLAIDFHVCSSEAAASIDVMTYYGICPTNDKYYKRMIDVAAHQLTAISTNFNHDYSLGAPDTLSGYMVIYSGAGILRQWVTDQNVIGVLLEGLTGLPNQTVYAANAFKANEELLVNYILTSLNYLKG